MLTLLISATTTVAPFALSTSTVVQDAYVSRAPALFHWGDWDGDGVDDALVVSPAGEIRLLRNRRDGSFEDATGASGLEFASGVTAIAWGDYDADGRLDLFVGSALSGPSLFRNAGKGLFERADVQLKHEGVDRLAHWNDYDQDGLLDLHLHTDRGDVLFHNQGATLFEPVELPEFASPDSAAGDLGALQGAEPDTASTAAADAQGRRRQGGKRGAAGPATSGGGTSMLINPPPGSSFTRVGTAISAVATCNGAPNVNDQASMSCIFASSAPTLGMLFPLSSDFNVSASGNVGMGTTTPAHRLHVIESAATGIFGQGGTTGVRGEANLAGTGNRYGGYFTSSGGSNNIGVFGTSSIAVYGVGTALGVLGETNNPASIGVHGRANHVSATTTGVLGESASTNGTGVKGLATATTGATVGVHGVNSSNDLFAAGVRGEALGGVGSNIGVRGTTVSSSGYGLRGEAQSSAGAGFGVYGTAAAPNATGVWGDHAASTGASAGVQGRTFSSTLGAAAVRGESATSTSPAYGVQGTASASAGTGVYGQGFTGVRGEGTNAGLLGIGADVGVAGQTSAPSGIGVRARALAITGATYGVHSETNSDQGTGVFGLHSHTDGAAAGVHGVSNAIDGLGVGVRGESTSTSISGFGVYGSALAPSGTGVRGEAMSSTGTTVGVDGSVASSDGIGVRGRCVGSLGDGEGVRGESSSPDGFGVVGNVPAGAGLATGILGSVGTPTYFAKSGVSGSTDVVGGYGVGGYTDQGAAGVIGVHDAATGTAPGVLGSTANVSGQTGYTGARSAGVKGQVTHALASNDAGVIGVGTPQAGWGIGGHFTGGEAGVVGVATALPAAGNNYAGLFIAPFSGPGLSEGVQGLGQNGGSFYGMESGTSAGIGVFGSHESVNGTSPGVWGFSRSDDSGAPAVRGSTVHTAASDTIGVRGISEPRSFYGIGGDFDGGWMGVRGTADVPGTGEHYGGYFTASGSVDDGSYGVYARATGPTTSLSIGLFASVGTSIGYAGFFDGDVAVSGTLSKGAGSFKIDHPLDPENKYLYHSFVESPDMKNIYDGVAVLDSSGTAVVELPNWFGSINDNFRYQLTSIGAPGPNLYIARKIEHNRFSIAGGLPGMEVSWQVTGIRKDPFAESNRIPVEQDKRPEERGLYLYPEAYGLPRERGLSYVLHEQRLAAKEAPLNAAQAAHLQEQAQRDAELSQRSPGGRVAATRTPAAADRSSTSTVEPGAGASSLSEIPALRELPKRQ
ncbi:MAG: VCBS repeat-containing protein [Planctomycetes bacterium]|nr:VCBS repeat-containing protein [Planctomycetota bacterium]